MFEKEAEEYVRNKMGGKEFELITDDDVSKYEETQKDWQKGAEFGYNKAKEEMQAQIEKMKCCENCKHHRFWGNELGCQTLTFDEELKCMDTKEHWEMYEDD